MDGTTHGGPPGTGDGPANDADTAPQPVLTPELAAAAAAATEAEFAHRHAHERTAEHHHEAPHGVVTHPAPRHTGTVVPEGAPRPWRRTALLLTAVLLVVGAVSAWALTRSGGTPTAQPSPTPSVTASPTGTLSASSIDPTAAPGITQTEPMLPPGEDTLVLGDSLALTVYPYLADLVPDRYVSYEAEVGRTTGGTAAALRAMSSIPQMVIVSSGTNDADGASLEADATEILDRLGPDRCVVWVDVVRPDSQYAPASELNAAIDRVAAGRDNVRVLQWTELVATHPGWMSSEGIHPNREGSIGRANAFAAASEACSPFDANAPRARKQYLPLSAFYGPISGRGTDTGSGTGTSQSAVPAASATPSVSDLPAPPPPDSTPTPSVPGDVERASAVELGTPAVDVGAAREHPAAQRGGRHPDVLSRCGPSPSRPHGDEEEAPHRDPADDPPQPGRDRRRMPDGPPWPEAPPAASDGRGPRSRGGGHQGAEPAVHVRRRPGLDVEQGLPQAHRDRAGPAVADGPGVLRALHRADGGDDRGGPAGEHLGEVARRVALAPVVGRDPTLLRGVAEILRDRRAASRG